MARILPDGWREVAVTGAAQREIETLALLASGRPDDYTVYHAVHWTGIDGGHAIYGEIDFAVVNLAGDLLLIEQKGGFLDETAAGLVKQYPGKSKSVPVQISRMVSNPHQSVGSVGFAKRPWVALEAPWRSLAVAGGIDAACRGCLYWPRSHRIGHPQGDSRKDRNMRGRTPDHRIDSSGGRRTSE